MRRKVVASLVTSLFVLTMLCLSLSVYAAKTVVTIDKSTVSSGTDLSGKFEILDVGINQFVHSTGTDQLKTGFWVKYNVLENEKIYLTNDRPNAYIAVGHAGYARFYPDEKIDLSKPGIHTAVSKVTLVKSGKNEPLILDKGVYVLTHRGSFIVLGLNGRPIGYTLTGKAEDSKDTYFYQDKDLIKNLTFVLCNLQNYQVYFKQLPQPSNVIPGGEIRVALALKDGDGSEFRVPARGPMKVTLYDQNLKEKVIYLEPEYEVSSSYKAPVSNGRFYGKLPLDIKPKKLVFEYTVTLIGADGQSKAIPVSKTVEGSAAAVNTPSSAVTRVGIYYPKASGGKSIGALGLLEGVRKEKGIEATLIDNLEPQTIFAYDVIVLPGVHKLGSAEIEENWRLNLSNYVDSGRGIMLTHDSCGYRHVFSVPLFPQICKANSKTDNKPTLMAVENNHPVTAGLVGKEFKHGYWDHINLIPGDKGKVLVKDKDGHDILVVGELGGGRVMAFGGIPGFNAKNVEAAPVAEELDIVIKGLKWLSGGTKRNVSLQQTKNTIFAETTNINNQSEVSYSNLPPAKFKFKMMFVSMSHCPWILNKDDAVEMVDDIHRMGFNAIWLIVYNIGRANYNSALAETMPEYCRGYFPKEICGRVPLCSEFDPLKCIIEEAHKRNIKVFAGFAPFNGGDRNYPNSFYKAHPEYLQYDKDEIKDLKSGKLKSAFDTRKIKGCPDRPEVRKYVLNLIKEVLDKYPVDGIGLDYIRYHNERACYCDYSENARKEYAKQHTELFEDEVEAKFSEDTIVSFVNNVKKLIGTAKPKVALMAYTHPVWANKFPLDYHSRRCSGEIVGAYPLSRVDELSKELATWAKICHPNTMAVPDLDFLAAYTDDGVAQKSAERVITELRIASKSGVDGVMLFHYGQLLKGYPDAQRAVHRPIFSPAPLRPSFNNKDMPVMQAIADELGGKGWKNK